MNKDFKGNSLGVGQKVGRYTLYQRSKRDWTLQVLADKTDLTPSFINRLERGEYASVQFEVIEQLASAFDTELTLFLYKCKLIPQVVANQLPNLEFFFKEKYYYPPEAIEDIKLFLKFVEEKYKQQIKTAIKAHDKYWCEEKNPK